MSRDRDTGSPDSPRWIEISRPLKQGIPVWPGDREFVLEQHREAGLLVSGFSTTCHVGTHLDAPLHLDRQGAAVEDVPIDRYVGTAEVLHVPSNTSGLTPEDLPVDWAPSTLRVLVRSDSYPPGAPMAAGFLGLSADLVNWLADRGVEMVGIDTPSVDVFDSQDLPAHHALLERGMTWIEGLWLENAPAGFYELIALPMLLEGAEAAPVRAILRPVED